MDLVALRPLTGRDPWGNKYRADCGDRFEVIDRVAQRLMYRGLARQYFPPISQAPPPLPAEKLRPVVVGQPDPPKATVQYECKVIEPEPSTVRYETKDIVPTPPPRKRGRPPKPTQCPVCGLVCPSQILAKRHCK